MTSKEALKMVQRYSNGNIILIDNQIVNLDECFNTIKADLEVLELLKNQFGEVEIEGSTAIWNYQKRIAENVYALKIIKQATGNAIRLYFKTEEEAQRIKEWLKK